MTNQYMKKSEDDAKVWHNIWKQKPRKLRMAVAKDTSVQYSVFII